MVGRLRQKIARYRANRIAVALYSGDVDEQLAGELRAKLDSDPLLREQFEEANEVLGGLDEWREEFEYDPSLVEPVRGTGGHKAWLRIAAFGGVAAAAMAYVALVVNLDTVDTANDAGIADRFVTGIGERREVTLEDGTTMAMNTNSEVIVVYTDSMRRLRLQRGEAYFDVSKDPARPFSVELQGQVVSVRGTQFNIRRAASGFSVALFEGRLALHQQHANLGENPRGIDLSNETDRTFSASEYREVGAGVVIDFDKTDQQITVEERDDLARRQAWRNGRLTFNGESLEYVIEELNRYSHKRIILQDYSVAQNRIYLSNLDMSNLSDALLLVENAGGVTMTPYPDRILVSPGE